MKRDKKWLTNEIEIMGSETSENYPHEQMVDREVVLNLIDQLDEPEKVVVTKEIYEFLNPEDPAERREVEDIVYILKTAYANEEESTLWNQFDWIRDNPAEYMLAVRYGCEVEKEPLYYAQVKGHSLTDSSDTYWHVANDLYVVLAGRNEIKNGENKLTLEEWADFGITSENAEFTEVEE